MKKLVIVCAAALLCGALLMSCKKSAKDAARAENDNTPLIVWVYDNGRINILTEIGKKFEEEYGVPIQISLVDLGQIRTQFLLASGGAECADIAIIPHDNLGSLVENAAVIPIDLGVKKDSFLPAAVQGFTYNGQVYGVPLSVENIGFFYNTDMMKEPPKTWEEFADVGRKLVKSGKAEVICSLPDATYNAYPVYQSFGGAIFGKKADGSYDPDKIEIADKGFVTGLEFLTNLVKEKMIPQTIDWDSAHVLFENGKAPFCFTGPWALNRFKTAGVHYAIAPFPSATAGGEQGAPFLGVQGMIISAASKHQLLASAFALDFVATEENMKAIFGAEQRPSAWKSVFDSAADPDTKGFNVAGTNAIPMPSIPAMGYVWDSWVNAVALSFSGEKTPADALANAKVQIETQIKNGK
jgi:arabinogalactan oligomer / maltooligosaccharide transport system substrate-binding protein